MKKIFSILFLLLPFFPLNAQDSIVGNPGTLTIGVTEMPPFVIEEDGEYSGLSIASWELVNDKLETGYQFKAYYSLGDLLVAVENGEVDFSINPITVTDLRMKRMDFSQPYFISHTGVAKKSGSMIWSYISNILSWNFISAILILVGVIFIFGFLVWLFERKKNPEEFGEGSKGIFQGFWWSAVTMTTVGYGDKSPRSLGGRIVGFIWMFMAIIMISSLTAGIASSLTVRNMQNEINSVQDLANFKVITVRSSSAAELLDQYGIASKKVSSTEAGFQQILQDKSFFFVYDQPILRHYVEQQELGDELEVLQKTLKKDYYSYSFPKGSELIEVIDPILVSTLKTMEWNNLIAEYK